MTKTKVYLSESDILLHTVFDKLDYKYPEYQRHPKYYLEFTKENLIGKSFCTHHGAFVNIFGELVYQGVVSHKDVEIHILSVNEENKIEDKIVNYTEDGYVGEGWIVGFFSWGKLG